MKNLSQKTAQIRNTLEKNSEDADSYSILLEGVHDIC